MRKAKRVIGYVCDIPVPDTDLVISKDDQRFRIMKYAKNEDLEIIHIYEDEEYTDDFINRPGVQKILNSRDDLEILLVERVWCLSRRMNELMPFLKKLERNNIQIVTSSYLWDDVSQGVRHYNLVARLRRERKKQADTDAIRDVA